MAKRTTAKSTAKKAAPKKAASKKEKPEDLKKKKTAAAKPKAAAKKTTAAKKTSKPKSEKSSAPRKTMTKKTTKKQEEPKKQPAEAQESPAAIRAKALAKIKGYNKKDLEYFREIILEKRDEIIEQLQNLRDQMMDPTTGEYINENSPYSLHMAEQGTDAMEREKTFLYAQRENKFLGYLEDALKRIDSGTYGICIECIEEPQHLCETCPLVPKPRLAAVPHSQLCLPIKQRQEKR